MKIAKLKNGKTIITGKYHWYIIELMNDIFDKAEVFGVAYSSDTKKQYHIFGIVKSNGLILAKTLPLLSDFVFNEAMQEITFNTFLPTLWATDDYMIVTLVDKESWKLQASEYMFEVENMAKRNFADLGYV